MYDPLDYVIQVARRARMEEAPGADVAPAVMRRLRSAPPSIARPLSVFTAVTAAVTLGVVVLALAFMDAVPASDPLTALYQVAFLPQL